MLPTLRQRRKPPAYYITAFIAAGTLLGVLTALWRNGRRQPDDLPGRRAALLAEVERWNREAEIQGWTPEHLLVLDQDRHQEQQQVQQQQLKQALPMMPDPRSAAHVCPPCSSIQSQQQQRQHIPLGGLPSSSCSDDQMETLSESAVNPDLVRLLKEVSINNEVMLALANGVMICQNVTICWWGGGNILKSWLETLKYVGITNYIIGVLDDETEKYLRAEGETRFFRPSMELPESQKGSHPANQVSTLKYGLVKQVLQLGYGVLVADMDLVFLKDPFQNLHRDSDLESQTDGFTERWSYGQFGGIQDKTMGWGGGGLYVQVFTLNVGCIFIRPNARTVDLMERIHSRLMAAAAWDQQLVNEEVFFPSHGAYKGSQVSVRIMDILQFMNSKIFFRSKRSDFIPGRPQDPKDFPVMIHMNYHPDKHKRMLCLIDRYIHKKWDACDSLPGGSEPGT